MQYYSGAKRAKHSHFQRPRGMVVFDVPMIHTTHDRPHWRWSILSSQRTTIVKMNHTAKPKVRLAS